MYAGGLQQPGTTVVIVQQPGYGRQWQNRAPIFLRNGVQMGGVMVGLHFILCLGIFGVFFFFGGIMFMAIDADAEFWAKFDRTHGPATVAGAIMFVIGLCLITASIVIAIVSKKKYEEMKKKNQDNPGRVINPNPGTYPPGVAPPYGMNPGTEMPPYPPGGVPPYGMNPGAQVPPYPPMSGYPAGQPPPYPVQQPGPFPGEASQPLNNEPNAYSPPVYSEKPSDSNKPGLDEYSSPPAYVPDYKDS